MGRQLILDTNRLIAAWLRRCRGSPREYSQDDARAWARELIRLHNSRAIVTPVKLEFLCGCLDRHELQLYEAFLDEFECLDGGDIRREDWDEALRLSRRVPRDRRRRNLADCLIRAIANRLRCDVDSGDTGMPR